MATTSINSTHCARCGQTRELLDEHDRCQTCVTGLQHIVCQDLYDLEYLVQHWLAQALTGEQLHAALDLILQERGGTAPGTPFRRKPVDTDEGGVWYLEPASAFLDDDDEAAAPPDRLARLRVASGLSREEIADRLGVRLADVALWESGEPPAEMRRQLADLFGVAEAFLMGEVA